MKPEISLDTPETVHSGLPELLNLAPVVLLGDAWTLFPQETRIMNAKKIFSVVTAFLLAFGLSTVAIAGPASAVVAGDGGGGGGGGSTSTPTPTPTSTEDGSEGGDGGEGGHGYTTTVKDATASVTVTPASCSAPATLVYGTYAHSTVQSGSPTPY